METDNTSAAPSGDVTTSRNKILSIVAVSGAGILLLCMLVFYLTRMLAPPKLLLGRQGDVFVYVSPSDYSAGDNADLIVRIGAGVSEATAIRQVTLSTRSRTELFSTGVIFEDPPWGETVWGEGGGAEETYPIEIPRRIPADGLKCVVQVDYVEARVGPSGGFRNKGISVTMPVVLRPSGP